jgi:hypothetical protein
VNVLNLSHERIATINETRLDPGPNVHKNTGNKNACRSKEVHQSVVSFVKDKGEICGECYATRLIRHLTKYELRDEEKDAVDLPSNFTYRSLYEQYCYGGGWLGKADNKGRYPRLEDYNKRKKDDCLFEEEDMVMEEVVSWWYLPKIHIRAPCNDTCGECTILSNAFCYREMRQRHNELSDSSNSDEDEDEERPNDFKEGEGGVSHLAKSILTSDCVRQEVILEAAGFHVTQARAMR